MGTLGLREASQPAGMTARRLSGGAESSAAGELQESPATTLRTDFLDGFLMKHPLKSRWLDDIIDALRTRVAGTAHVREIVCELWGENDIDFLEHAVTRKIDDYCSDADDFNRPKAYDLFERVAPSIYKLRSYPNKPDVLELMHISFAEPAIQSTWELFATKARADHRWKLASNWQKLSAFAKNMGDYLLD